MEPLVTIRGIVVLHLGDPFGRSLSVRPPQPGLFCDASADEFDELERVIGTIRDQLAGCAVSEWKRKAKEVPVPRVRGRRVRVRLLFVDCGPDSSSDIVMLRAMLPTLLWPFGGRVVFAGWNRSNENVWTPLSEDELVQHW